MPPRHALRCLGVPELRGPTGEPIRFRTRKHLALLVFLAVEPRRRHRRDRLADLLWPEASPAEGRHSLATALSVIRGKMGLRTFESTRDTVRFVAADLEVDLARLTSGDILGDEITPPLEVGGFLDDFDIGRAPEFMVWRDQQRARWFPAIREAFVILMDRCRRTGNQVRIEPLADRLLELDELSEEAIRAKMEARAFAGDRLSAIRIFQAWRKRLADEVGATPSPLVEGMALRLRQRGYEPPGTSHIPTVPTDQWRNRAFIGRGRQYQVVYELWEGMHRGRGQHALLLGDSGIGKTTLAERLVTAAGLEGAVSSRVQCYECERDIPFTAISTLVRGLLERPGASATPPEWLAAVARVVPAVRDRYPHLPPAPHPEGESARLQLAEGIHQLVAAVADEHPVILVVDDVHLADDASVAVLHLLLRRTRTARVMIVLAARESELKQSARAGQLLDHRESLGLTPVELAPLTQEETGEVVRLLAAAGNVVVIPAVRRALVRAAAGIPMVLELLFDDWRIHGEQSLALSVDAMTAESQADAGQEMYRRLLERVFRDLPEAGRAVLNLAAILGERLNDLPMYQLVDLTLAQTLAGMAELTQRRILRDGGREMEFRNELLRGYAYMQVPSPLRRALHGLIADRLISAEDRGEHVPGLMLAWHCFRSARPLEAIPYLLRGAREAMDGGAPYDAEFALKTAMASLGDDVKPVAKLLLAEALQEQGRWEESVAWIDGETWHSPDTNRQAEVLRAHATAACLATREIASSQLKAIETYLENCADTAEAAHLILSGSQNAHFLSDKAAASRLLKFANAVWSQTALTREQILIATARTSLAWVCNDVTSFTRSMETNIALLEEANSGRIRTQSTCRLILVTGCLHVTAGNYQLGLEAFTEVLERSKHSLDERLEAGAAHNIGICRYRLGDYRGAKEVVRQSLCLRKEQESPWEVMRTSLLLGRILAMIGDFSKALAIAEEAQAQTAGEVAWLDQAHGAIVADIFAMCGERSRSLLAASEAVDKYGGEPLSSAYAGTLARWVALVAGEAGEWNRAYAHQAERKDEMWRFDAVDRAEILSAEQWLNNRTGRQVSGGWHERMSAVSHLPSAVVHQIARCGLGLP